MNLSYFPRLICLCLASFFLVNLLLDLVVFAVTGAAFRFAARLPARDGARFLFALRIAPCAIALCTLVYLCVPSYLRMEPQAIDEPVGWLCLTAAILATAVWSLSLERGLRATIHSARYIRQCRNRSQLALIPGEKRPVWILEGRQSLFALAGILRPRLILSRQVVDALSSDELASALRHEHAHRASHDNLKRLTLLLIPCAFPMAREFRRLEEGWARFAEWAADDLASGGVAQQSLTLAAALVRVTRMAASNLPQPHLLTAFVGGTEDLQVRVNRLLRTQSPAESNPKRFPLLTTCSALLAAVVVCAMLRPETQRLAHELLERLL